MTRVVPSRWLDTPAAKAMTPHPWVFLGSDRMRQISLARRMGEAFPCLPTNALFREIVGRLMPAVETILSEIVSQLPAGKRQICPASEGNLFNLPALRQVFLYFLFLKLVEQRDDLLVVVEHPRLWNHLVSQYAGSPGFDFPVTDRQALPPSHLFEESTNYVRQQIMRKRPDCAVETGRPITLLQCWATAETSRRGNSLSLYYGPLAAELARHGETVVPFIGLLVPEADYAPAKARLLADYPTAVFPEDLLTATDLASICLRDAFWPRALRPVRIAGHDVSAFLDPGELLGGGHFSKFALGLYHCFKRLRQRGATVAKFIYLFENQAWERLCLQGLRRYHPGSLSIGFQHTLIPHYWGYEPPQAMVRHLEAPDRLVCDGNVSMQKILPHWGEKTQVRLGAALRQTHLHTPKQAPARETGGPVLGLATSYSRQQTLPLIAELPGLLAALPEWRVVMKYHPTTTPPVVAEILGLLHAIGEPGARVTVFSGDVTGFLAKVDAVLGPGTSLLTEAALAGLPTFQYAAFHDLDLSHQGIVHPLLDDLGALIEPLEAIARDRKPPQSRPDMIEEFYHALTPESLRAFS